MAPLSPRGAREMLRAAPEDQESIWDRALKQNALDVVLALIPDTDFHTLKTPVLAWSIRYKHNPLPQNLLSLFLQSPDQYSQDLGIHPNKG